jgi:transposase
MDPGSEAYAPTEREAWEKELPLAERKLAKQLAMHLDAMTEAYKRAGVWLENEAAKVPEVKRLCTVPGLGTIAASQIVATVITPERFRTKRLFWSYCGLAIVTRSSADYVRDRSGKRRERRDVAQTRGLNRNRQPMLKAVFKSAAITVLKMKHPLVDAYEKTLEGGTKPTMARLTLARRIAAASLAVWKKKEDYDSTKHCARPA